MKSLFYKLILLFAIADFAFGIISMFVESLPLQISALSITAITLLLSIVFAVKYPKGKRTDFVVILVGSLDLITTLISVLVIVMATQLLAIFASGFNLFKIIKIFIQSEKAKELLNTSKPIFIKLIKRASPALFMWITQKIKKTNIYKKGDIAMDKIKQFLVKTAQLIRANKISLSGTVLNGGAWSALGILANNVNDLAVNVCGFNITPLFSIIGFIIAELTLFWETTSGFIERVTPKIEEKEQKKKEKELAEEKEKKERERAEILAQIQAEKDRLAEMERAKAEEAEKAEHEKEEAAKRAEEDKEIAEWLAKQEQAKANNQMPQ